MKPLWTLQWQLVALLALGVQHGKAISSKAKDAVHYAGGVSHVSLEDTAQHQGPSDPCGARWVIPQPRGRKGKRAEEVSVADDYNKENEIAIWKSHSPIPVTVEVLIAMVWIAMVCCMPLVIMYFQGGKLSRTQKATHGCMLVAFVSGLVIFTNVIRFSSVHFETERSLTIVECIYLMAQIISTVGYGDIVPAKPRGQVFVAIFVICSLLFIANALSEMVNLMVLNTKKKVENLQRKVAEMRAHREGHTRAHEARRPGQELQCARDLLVPKRPELPWNKFLSTFGMYCFFVVLGVTFFHMYPGENRTIIEGLYMSVITLSTVGFGAVTPKTEAGKVFAAFWMVFGSAALLAVVGSFTELTMKLRALETFSPQCMYEKDHEILQAMPDKMNFEKFLRFGLLRVNLVSNEDIAKIENSFGELKSPDDLEGWIKKDAIQRLLVSSAARKGSTPRSTPRLEP